MLHAECTGSSREIGFQHGQQAKAQVHGSINFYKDLFAETTGLTWEAVCEQSLKFLPFLERDEKSYVEEMRGLATGASTTFESVLALNVRTEIAYGMFKDDGCTALAWWSNKNVILAQNWDWRDSQKPNLIRLTICQSGHKIAMITEAGIIGKIGINSAGFGVCLNAIRVRGVSYEKLPVHLALRKVLDERRIAGLNDVYALLRKKGIASSAHILVASTDGALGLETTYEDAQQLTGRDGKTPETFLREKETKTRVLTHTNHLIKPHEGVDERLELLDSPARLKRIDELLDGQIEPPNVSDAQKMLRDEQGYPTSICRDSTQTSKSTTCFSIVMDLKARVALVKMGRPTEDGEEFKLDVSN